MKNRNYLWLAILVLALVAGACGEPEPTPTPPPPPPPPSELSYNKTMDTYLGERYLWNTEYKAMTRDLSIAYKDDGNNFAINTLMSMTANTLDKKIGTSGSYRLYSYVTRTDKSSVASAQATRGVNHGVQKELETGFGFINFTPAYADKDQINIVLVVEGVYPNSPADKAGIRRGTAFNKIKGINITVTNYQSLFLDIMLPAKGTKIDFVDVKNQSSPISLTAEEFYNNPIIHSEIIESDAHKIGYLVYDSFDAAYDDELLAEIQNFRTAGINDFVLDLRYNGGGHVITSNMLSTCIAGPASQNKVFQFYRYNNDRMQNSALTAQQTGNAYDSNAKLFYKNFDYGMYWGVNLTGYALNLPRLYVLTSGGTASSSEAVLNSLQGIGVEVILIGKKTNGKNVGMEVKRFNDGNYSFEFVPITFQAYNALKNTVPPTGIPVQYEVDEWDGGFIDFGATEPLVAKALELITGNAAAAQTRISGTNLLRKESIALPERLNRPSGMLVLTQESE